MLLLGLPIKSRLNKYRMHRKDLLEKHLKGKLSEVELIWLIDDLSRASDGEDYQSVLQQLWKDAEKENLLPPADSQRLLAAFQKHRQKSTPQRTSRTPRIWYRAAAVAGIILASIALWLFVRQNQTVTYATGYGEVRTFTLPDNSTVTLNANSSLRHAPDWNSDAPREVWLDGEAYFSVTHTQNDQPFLVHVTDALRVEVLGTAFNVKDRRRRAEVVLTTGKVKLSVQKNQADSQTLAMQPGELVAFSEANQTLRKKQVDPEQYAAWRDHKMIFDQMSLQELARQLEDVYGVSIAIEGDGLANTTLTGAFPTHNLEMILTSLPTIIDMEILRNEDQITFKRE